VLLALAGRLDLPVLRARQSATAGQNVRLTVRRNAPKVLLMVLPAVPPDAVLVHLPFVFSLIFNPKK
jgi:hypothetical protein